VTLQHVMGRRRVLRFVAGASLLFGAVVAGCGDSAEQAPEPVVSTSLPNNGSSIDRSAVPPGAAPGDGSGAGKTPEGNSNSGDTPTSSAGGASR
jgi:hypothetical protein